MAQVKQDLQKMNPLELAQYADDVVAAMTGNSSFGVPTPALSALTDKATAVRKGQTEVAAAETVLSDKRSLVRAQAGDLKTLLTNEGTYVQGVANTSGNTDEQASAIIKSAHMDVKSAGSPVGALPAPTDVAATQGDMPNEVDTQCHSVKGASSYVWETCAGDDPIGGPWVYATTTTKSSVTLSNLASGSRQWVRVSAVGTAGAGPHSAPTDIRVA